MNNPLQTITSIAEFRQLRKNLPATVGFVPTMGYLHEGHLTLVRQAREENRSVVASIFVNPTQFGPKEDFAAYPRDIQRDLDLLQSVGTDVVLLPEASEMYPPGFNSWVVLEEITSVLEGAARPGHFRGVTTVVAKLLNIVEPDKAYFGQKDAQQLMVIRKMVRDLNMNLEIVGVPTVREADGLAMSSRNTYLSPAERQSALILYKSLQLAQHLRAGGEVDAELIRQRMKELIGSEPAASIDYVSISDRDTLQELEQIDRPALVSLAVRIGKTRLIDNIMLEDTSGK